MGEGVGGRGSGPKGGGAGAAGSGADSTHGGNVSAGGMFGGVNPSAWGGGGYSMEGVFGYGPEYSAGFDRISGKDRYGVLGIPIDPAGFPMQRMDWGKPTPEFTGIVDRLSYYGLSALETMGTPIGAALGIATGLGPVIGSLVGGIASRMAQGYDFGEAGVRSITGLVGTHFGGLLGSKFGDVGATVGEKAGGYLAKKAVDLGVGEDPGVTQNFSDPMASDSAGNPLVLHNILLGRHRPPVGAIS